MNITFGEGGTIAAMIAGFAILLRHILGNQKDVPKSIEYLSKDMRASIDLNTLHVQAMMRVQLINEFTDHCSDENTKRALEENSRVLSELQEKLKDYIKNEY